MANPKLPPILINKAGSVYYVYTYKNVWDRELKRSKRGESKKIGTILGGQKDGKIRFDEAFLQEHPEFRNYQVERKGKDYVFTQISEEGITLEQARNIKKLYAGATWALDQIVADSPVGEFLKECFPRNKDYKKILSLAYFLILNQNNSVSFYESFAETTRLPYPRPLSPSAVTRLFQRIELRDVRRYFLLMRSYLQEDEDNKIILALDSTSISSYSTRLTHIEYGKNKDDDALPQLNVLFLVDQKSGLPIFYRFYDGNVPDVSTIRHTIADQALLNMKSVVLVADKGYNSVKNINDCLINKVEFIFNVRLGTKGCLARELIDEHRKEFADLNSGDPYIRKNIATAKVNWKYDPRPVDGKPASNSATAELYYHMFYDPVIYQEAGNKLTESLLTDKGYNSVKNINDCLINKVEFIFNVRLGTKGCLARELIDEHRKEFADLNSGDPYIRKNIATAKVNWKYDPRPVDGKPASNSATAELYYHMFYDPVIYQEAGNKLTESLLTIKKKLLENEALTEQEEELKEKFFRNDKEKGLIIVNRRVDDYLKYKGFRVLVSDSEKDPVKAWTAYADRRRVEDAFATLKDRLGCNRIRCSDNKALQGKTFVQFIATGLSLMVRSRIRCYMKENKTAGKL
ncbi:IS1634 family transposase, partial [Parasutterella excrementihominis]|uniref:IS1634 family transposase n=1 Tax=Parasutterella excrementihominis TaxID=487175 RepID=UPI001F4F82C6